MIIVKIAHGRDTITEHPMHCEAQGCVNTVLLLPLLRRRPSAALMGGYQNQTTAHCCARMSLGENEWWVLSNDGDHRGLNRQLQIVLC